MKLFLFVVCFFISFAGHSQYIGVRARYTETRTVDNTPNAPSRENRLILSFYDVTASGSYIPTSLSNFDIWVYKEGLQYGSFIGGVLDSAGNNYPGYAWTAPMAVAYYNSYNPNYIDCDPNAATRYTVNGHELDCGFIRVSYWEPDPNTSIGESEFFTAPNVCLPYYIWPHPYAFSPGNVNFSQPVPATTPYNWYNYTCAGSTLQLVIRGVLQADTGSTIVTLPVRFANVRGTLSATNTAEISWSNLTESDVDYYEIQKSTDGTLFQTIGRLLPSLNNGGRVDYVFTAVQTEPTVFYRIKAVELTGQSFYSSILHLRKADSNNPVPEEPVLSIYPNPVINGQFTIRITNATAGRYISTVVNAQGQQLRHKMIEHNGGDLTRQFDITGLIPGIYQLVIRSDSQKFSQRFVYVN